FICFTDHENIRYLQDTRFDGLHFITHTGGADYQYRLRGAHHLDLSLTRSYCLDDDRIVASGIHRSHHVSCGGRKPAQTTTTRHTANEDVGVARQLHHADTITQNSSPSERTGGVNSHYSNFALSMTQFSHKVRYQSTFSGTWRAR